MEPYRNDIPSSESAANEYSGNTLMIYCAAQIIGEENKDEGTALFESAVPIASL